MLVTFLSDLAAEVNDPVYGFCKKDKGYDKSKSTSATFAMSTQPVDGQDSNIHAGHKSSPYARPESPCILCGQTHRLWHCVNFKRLSPKDRLDIVIKNNLCHNCLLSTHQTSKCGKKSVCSVKGCGKKHTMYIHIDDETNVSTGQTDITYMNDFVGKDVYMPVVVVTVNDTERVLALLDPGSSNSFCSERLSRNLGIKADALSRGQTLANLDQDIWFGGPNFLRGYKGNWSQVKCSNELVADDPESPCEGGMSIKEVRKAKILLIKHVQQQHFSDEIARLLTGASVAKSSPLRLLIPFIDRGWFAQGRGKINRVRVSGVHVILLSLFPFFVVHRFFEWSAIDILHYRKHSCLRVFLAAHHSVQDFTEFLLNDGFLLSILLFYTFQVDQFSLQEILEKTNSF
ncbi:hypothetical protein HOLleu_12262 [Holothuria leucospilota]|uniref:Uncharacterized protein n=1 Tax=Holothuria leucospilota TaxID=206669 RepID=A0A9Q1C8Y2_HOLLE|nr:hypothetical protein HOLleu_12262 [Holothuria leucospilota]